MYEQSDTIVAVSSPSSSHRVIVRISGPDTVDVLQNIFDASIAEEKNSVTAGGVAIDEQLKVYAQLYLFVAPRSYTGETLAEIHLYTNPAVIEKLLENLLNKGLRMAGPGEFTARAFLNGKMDLTQAEAINEIIVSSNRLQLAAAEKLLTGSLAKTAERIRSEIMDCVSLIEAGLDFSGEDIEFISRDEAVERLSRIKSRLEQLLSGSISCESMLDLPSVGIAGAPNAGKSSLLNELTGCDRSIVSSQRKTTRDVLTGELSLRHCRCVLFDCAGLTASTENILDELTQQAAVEALRNSSVILFCVDLSKEDWSEDVLISQLVKAPVLIPVATKSDLLMKEILTGKLAELNKLFAAEFLPVSMVTGEGLEELRNIVEEKLIELVLGKSSGREITERASIVALTTRHRQAVTEAIDNVSESIDELKVGNDEITAMMLRTAYQSICDIEQHHLDDEILERIFSRFCIGK